MRADGRKRLSEQPTAVLVDLADDLLQRALGGSQIVELSLQRVGPLFQLLHLLERVKVDAAELAQLLAQLGNFFVGLLGGDRQWRRRALKGRQLNLIIFAETVHKTVAPMANVVDL